MGLGDDAFEVLPGEFAGSRIPRGGFLESGARRHCYVMGNIALSPNTAAACSPLPHCRDDGAGREIAFLHGAKLAQARQKLFLGRRFNSMYLA